MTDSSTNGSAEGYKQASLSVQKVDGEMFIHTDVSPQAGDAILNLGCGTGEPSAYLAELVGPEGKVIGVDPEKERIPMARQTHSDIKNLAFEKEVLRTSKEWDRTLYPLLDRRLTTLYSAMLPSTGYLGNKKLSRTCLKVLKLEAK